MNNWESTFLLANYAESNPDEKQVRQGYSFNHGLSPISRSVTRVI